MFMNQKTSSGNILFKTEAVSSSLVNAASRVPEAIYLGEFKNLTHIYFQKSFSMGLVDYSKS